MVEHCGLNFVVCFHRFCFQAFSGKTVDEVELKDRIHVTDAVLDLNVFFFVLFYCRGLQLKKCLIRIIATCQASLNVQWVSADKV